MNKQSKNKNKLRNNNCRRFRSNYIVNNSSRKFNITRYQKRTRPATFGPGTYKLVITKLFTGRMDVQQEVNILNDILATNPEYGRVSTDFKYIKLNGIVVTVMARNLSDAGNMTPAYILMNFDGRTTENIRLQDNVKVVPAFLVKDWKIKYNIPSINCYGGVLNNWNSVEDIYGYGDIICQMYAPSNSTNWHIRFDVIVTLKGPTNKEEIKVEEFKNIKEELENNKEINKEEEKKIKLIENFGNIDEEIVIKNKEKNKDEEELKKLKFEYDKILRKEKLRKEIEEMKEKLKEKKLITMDLRTVYSDNVA